MSFTIDGINKVITLTEGTTSVNVRDLWSRWVDWFLSDDNSKYLPAFKNVGGDQISEGLYVPIYVFLINGWRIKPQEAHHTLTVQDGILVVDGGGDPFINTEGYYTVRINYQQPVQAISFGNTIPEQDKVDIKDKMLDAVLSEHQQTGSLGKFIKDIKTQAVTNAGLILSQ